MATVRLPNGLSMRLPGRTRVGRAHGCHIQLQGRFASSDHAVITWSGGAWKIRDLGSKNGTYVDGRSIEPGLPVAITPGAKLGFGEPESGIEVLDVQPPTALAFDVQSREPVTGSSDLLLLPSPEQPQVSVYLAQSGEWLAEHSTGETSPVEDQEVLQVAGRSFRLELPGENDATPMVEVAFHISQVTLRFFTPKNEEKVSIELTHPTKRAWLEPREHAYLLLTLARARADSSSQDQLGWVSMKDLMKMLRCDETAINVHIHRARQQLSEAGVEGAASIVEVKRGARRLGISRFEIVTT